MGNSRSIAREHHLHVTGADIERALQEPNRGDDADKTDIVQNAAQEPATMAGNDTQKANNDQEQTLDWQGFSVTCTNVHTITLPPTGVEPCAKTPIKPHIPDSRAAKSAAFNADSCQDSQLRAVIEAWPSLPADFRAAIVRTARRGMNRLNTQGLAAGK